jgi:hypothetical protein
MRLQRLKKTDNLVNHPARLLPPLTMAGRASLNAKNLEALGPARLAALLLQHTEGNTAARLALRVGIGRAAGTAGDGA